MIPPSMMQQQAMMAQRSMAQPQDPLMAALSKQAMIGESLKQLADHKMKMMKIQQKYGTNYGQGMPKVQPASGGQGFMGTLY